MKYSTPIYLIFFIFSTTISAQTLKGKIVDQKKKPIEEAYIYNKKTGSHVHSDKSGQFSFTNISRNDTLFVSHINFKDTFVVIKDPSVFYTIQLEENPSVLEEVVIKPEINTLNLFTDVDIELTPVTSSQDVLRKVPGLFIGQHAGGGKAEQIFLRGFDADHGTDVNITVDGIPVNMVSHAHGQGYADMHFLIPETIKRLDFDKGSYNPEKGNFATAGYVNYETKNSFEQNSVSLEYGQFNTFRMVGLFNLINKSNQKAYIASEYSLTDGPFESPQNFSRFNVMGKYSYIFENSDELSFLISNFTSEWDASGQIPQRAVDNGSISRFGSIDDTEGGQTGRSNFLLHFKKKIDENQYVKNTFFYSLYDFELYSNFTFFLNDPVNGDQIRQKEKRKLFGWESIWNKNYTLWNNNGLLKTGLGFRNDLTDNSELSHTYGRNNTLKNIQLGDINEADIFGFIGTEYPVNKWILNPSVRIDYFNFRYNDALKDSYVSEENNQFIISPKFNIIYSPSNYLQLYLKMGKGFHSNDTRDVVVENDKKTLPASYGSDLGMIWKATPNLMINIAFWYLFLEQEFVYVGDEGIVEPSGRTQRTGIDLSIRYQFLRDFHFHGDLNYAHARSIDDPKGEDYIPLAPNFTFTAGLSYFNPSGFYGNLSMRHINNRPANEDNSIIAKGYTVSDLNTGYRFKNFDLSIIIQNLLNTEWEETQFATESRLFYETESVEEIHFTPGTPFQIRARLIYSF